MSKGKPITIQQIQNEAMQILNDAFTPQPTRSLIFDTGEAIYNILEYPTGWAIRREDNSMTLTNGLTEEEMWAMLKLLK